MYRTLLKAGNERPFGRRELSQGHVLMAKEAENSAHPPGKGWFICLPGHGHDIDRGGWLVCWYRPGREAWTAIGAGILHPLYTHPPVSKLLDP